MPQDNDQDGTVHTDPHLCEVVSENLVVICELVLYLLVHFSSSRGWSASPRDVVQVAHCVDLENDSEHR